MNYPDMFLKNLFVFHTGNKLFGELTLDIYDFQTFTLAITSYVVVLHSYIVPAVQ
jgi:hypothetical protein